MEGANEERRFRKSHAGSDGQVLAREESTCGLDGFPHRAAQEGRGPLTCKKLEGDKHARSEGEAIPDDTEVQASGYDLSTPNIAAPLLTRRSIFASSVPVLFSCAPR